MDRILQCLDRFWNEWGENDWGEVDAGLSIFVRSSLDSDPGAACD